MDIFSAGCMFPFKSFAMVREGMKPMALRVNSERNLTAAPLRRLLLWPRWLQCKMLELNSIR
jgi:hypothetical protein